MTWKDAGKAKQSINTSDDCMPKSYAIEAKKYQFLFSSKN